MDIKLKEEQSIHPDCVRYPLFRHLKAGDTFRFSDGGRILMKIRYMGGMGVGQTSQFRAERYMAIYLHLILMVSAQLMVLVRHFQVYGLMQMLQLM